jgi:hypothetical protein
MYFSAKDEENVLQHVYEKYGKPRSYLTDRESVKYRVKEIIVEEVKEYIPYEESY